MENFLSCMIGFGRKGFLYENRISTKRQGDIKGVT